MGKDGEGTQDRRVRKTRKLLKQGLAHLLRKKNINSITIKELVDLIDINRGTFYLHCKDLHDLLNQLEDEMMQDLTRILDSFSGDQVMSSMEQYLTAVIEYLVANSELCLALLGENGDLAFVNKLIDTVKNNCFQNLENGYPGQDPYHYEIFTQYTVYGSVGVIRQWMERGMERPAEEVAALLTRIIQGGIHFLETAKTGV